MASFYGPGGEYRARMNWEQTYGSQSPEYLNRQSSRIRDISSFLKGAGVAPGTPEYADAYNSLNRGDLSAYYKLSKSLIPKLGEGEFKLPRYNAPAYDRQRVESLTQRAASPALMQLRGNLRGVLGRSEENPNVAALTARNALQGYGQGVESILSGALGRGQAMYQPEFASETEAAQQNYQTDLDAMLRNYMNAVETARQTQAFGATRFAPMEIPTYRNRSAVPRSGAYYIGAPTNTAAPEESRVSYGGPSDTDYKLAYFDRLLRPESQSLIEQLDALFGGQ